MQKVQIGDCTLYLGDCLEVLPSLNGVDALVTDPPYGVLEPGDYMPRIRDDRGSSHGLVRKSYSEYQDTYANFCNCIVPALNCFLDIAKRAGVFTGPHIHEQRKPEAIGGVFCSAAAGRNRWGFKRFLPVLLYGTYPNLNKGCKIPSVIASNERAKSNGHPCPKPLGWMEWLVELVSLPGELVADPFMGSGTTGAACIRTGRRFIGVELDPQYFAIACKRIEAEYAKHKETLFS